jgi:RHS repeat-associated protein
MTTPNVQFGYANGAANHVRPTSLTYPDGRVLSYGYGTTDGTNDAASRLAALIDDDLGTTHLADYSYLGLRSFVETDYTEPEVEYTLVGTVGGDDPDTGDIYRGLDRFGRIKDSYWRDYGSSADVDRIKYGYDRNGNRLWRENPVATANSAFFDELYQYDRIDRLKHMERGRLNGQKDAITDKTFAQCWSLDSTGNWRKFTEDDDGDGIWNLDQLRASNRVNEITDLSEYAGPAWVTPAYSRAGNMTTIPKPADPTASFTGTYDAWNRLVKLEDGSGTVAQYEYDGAKRRTVKKSYTSGTLSETRHFYYTEPSKWQVIEERVDSETDPERQFVWGQRYIDDLLLRDRDTDADGDLDERLYAMQDANWNVTGIIDEAGATQERYAYHAYGMSQLLAPDFTGRATSVSEWETRFTGRERDPASGLQLNRNRDFQFQLGRWLTRDPIKYEEGGWSLYEYAGGKPLTVLDPQGLACLVYFDCINVGQRRVSWNTVRCDYSCVIDTSRGGDRDPPGMRTIPVGGVSCSDPRIPKGIESTTEYTNHFDIHGDCDCALTIKTQKAFDDWTNVFRDCSISECKKDAAARLKAIENTCKVLPPSAAKTICSAAIKAEQFALEVLCNECSRS